MLNYNKMSISKRILIQLVFLITISFIVVLISLFSSIENIENQLYNQVSNDLINIFKQKINEEKKIAITNAITLSENSKIINALKNNNKVEAYKTLKSLINRYKKSTKYKNVKIHIHTKDIHSFLRSWSKKSGDDLSSFRNSIVAVKNHKKAISCIEVGKVGLSIRGVAPIINDNKYYGSIEFILELNSIIKDLKKIKTAVIITVDKKFLNIASKLENNKELMDKFVIAVDDNLYDSTFYTQLKNEKFISQSNKYNITKDYFYISLPLEDFNGEKVGYAFIGKKLNYINSVADHSKESLFKQIGIFAVLSIVITILMTLIFS
ncbi:cache domain-containing protein [Hydrogenimonas thermophila]|uniref:cache domain-containing protein n=1 Tax=Hydrogenimonas thermophila TaxID=223786 RepID=UPI002936D5C3|nr:cache domain-containing protein [Hydrogenimonas thermophila]WOE70736.1 cache domain-containing protein [Hydrogenimonas thermophila]WOE73253.1 cache domain-containing protein [Hydrogenimonas thermophila]